jgi:hypothetical protein
MRFARIKNLQPRPAIGGYIKIGRTIEGSGAKGTYTRPDKLDHFEITTTKTVKEGKAQNFEFDTELMKRLIDSFIEEGELEMLNLCGGCERSKKLGFEAGLPRRMPIVLPTDDLEAVFPSRYAWYRGRTVFCEGNGEEAYRRTEEGDGYGDAVPWEYPCGDACPDMQQGRCKPHAVLRMVAPFQQRVGTLYQFSTTSRNSFRAILGGIEWVKSLVGTIAWIPLFLEMTNRAVTTREGKNTTAWIVALFYPGSAQQLLEHGQQEWGAIAGGKNKMKQLLGSLNELPEATEEEEAVRLAEFGVDVTDAEVVEGDNADMDAAPETGGPAESSATSQPPPATTKTDAKKARVANFEATVELLVKVDHPIPVARMKKWRVAHVVAAKEWAEEELLAIEAADADLGFERKLPRPSFIPEYGDFDERMRLGLDDPSKRPEPAAEPPAEPPAQDPNEPPPHGEPVAPPAPAPEDGPGATNGDESAPAPVSGPELTDDQRAALEELGWDGRGTTPTLDVTQCREVVALLTAIDLKQPQKCLDWIGQAINRPIMKTTEILVTELLAIRQAVADVKAELEKGASY